jgi:alkanesulfonate monooxygenase SsuD/methylene tetrahydromethanopterin reductase-like flavin-dependent oxidoreductase (luciferase family)
MLRYSAVGSPETIKKKLATIVDSTGANELILTATMFDHKARLRSFEIAAEILQPL